MNKGFICWNEVDEGSCVYIFENEYLSFCRWCVYIVYVWRCEIYMNMLLKVLILLLFEVYWGDVGDFCFEDDYLSNLYFDIFF